MRLKQASTEPIIPCSVDGIDSRGFSLTRKYVKYALIASLSVSVIRSVSSLINQGLGLTLVEHYKTDATNHSCVEASALKRNLHNELISSW